MYKIAQKSLLPILFLFILLTGVLKAQNNLSLNFNNVALIDVLNAIEKQSNVKFNYDGSVIDVNQKATIRHSGSLKDALNILSRQLRLDFGVVGNNISIRKAQRPVSPTVKMITGKIVSKQDGETLPGVNVLIKGTRQGAVTNINGEFTIKLVGDNIESTVLEATYLGFKPKEFRVGKETFFSIQLELDAIGINEVVVTSSYTANKRREDVVGSISQLTDAQLQVDRPIESFDKMMEGLVAGVYVETNTELGTPVKINIRGQGSLPAFGGTSRPVSNTSSQPLYVVDGIPMYEQQRGNENQIFNREENLNPLANINPDDIKSISVLKDATASALYGADAANGVIIITTKGGTAGKTKVNFSYDTGVATFINEFKWLSGPQYYSLLRETYINDGRSVTSASQLAGSNTIDTDWFDLTNRNATYHNANLEISGGKENTTFRFSAGYRDQQASSIGNDLQKTYIRLRLDHSLSDRFKVGFSLSPTLTNKNALNNYGGVLLPPNLSPYNEDGTFATFQGVPNPLAVLAQNDNFHKGLQLLSNLNATYKITDSWGISGTFGADFYQNRQTMYMSALNQTGANLNGRLAIFDRNYRSYTGFLQATYDKVYNNKHTVSFVAGTQVEDKTTNLLSGTGTDFSFDRLRVLGAAAEQSANSSPSENAVVSYYSQLGYDLNKKYYININGRVDQSSVFGGDRQVALNGSLGLGWIISKENFLKNVEAINLLKLRATYGSTGNSRIGSYAARGLYNIETSDGGTYNGNVSSLPGATSAPNPDLGWEKNFKFNLGLDLTVFNRFQLTAEYYNNTVVDLISNVNVPLETGFTNILSNTSKMRNQGFELSISSENIKTKNFTWSSSFNFGSNENKIIAFNNGFSALFGSRDEAAGFKVGNSANAIYGYRWGGVNPQTGLEIFFDKNGNIKTAEEVNALPITETVVIGDRLPDFQGGFINNFTIKDFTFSFNILYSYGADFKFENADETDGRNLQNRNQSINLIDRWQRPGDITNIPRLNINRDRVSNSSRYVLDASYLKLSNVSLNYKLPLKTVAKIGLNNLSVFANATNLFYVYKEPGVKNRNGIAKRRFTYPETMAITGGLRVGL
ncbi:SusC/RagA family TonB-linked outer membrane protein [Pedobacter glucosidilyticus]|uniref:SusC/RagA family TonB-linked outer membrane protein n=1 Tax=Pedobacter glucosidilyticus TaxID=1122941 RepID=UPI0004103C28|nr:SusC/RagA family TonB-linked outer membrane protein [Pedobacter glucosidilyticus]